MNKTLGLAVLLGVLGVGLAGCGAGGAPPGGGAHPVDAVEATAAAPMSIESQALLALGFDQADADVVNAAVANAPDAASLEAPGATASPQETKGDKGDRRRNGAGERALIMRLRHAFGKKALHGEVTVQTRNGTRTLVAQRGEITALTDATLTVRSADGYTLTWTFADKYHFFQHRRLIQPTDLKVGMQVGVAGFKDGDTPKARAVIIPKR
ncbi:hypothetical protein [Luedemannella helvata]|uniref:DUF5666 domain-containing protein n=1 Tax=Luedemannella helvata TaxID=349315 RepID=A0ABP4W922_9ACTN